MSFTTTDGSRAQDGTDAAVAFPHPMVDAALHYGERWSIFPCHWPLFKAGKVMCSCGKPPGKGKGLCSSPGKHPRTAHGFYDATRDPDAIRALWRRMPLANIGLRTGTDNDLLVLDVDPPHGGDKSLAAMVAKHGPLPPTLIANTGSGGRHFLFRHVDGLSNCVGAIGGGLDIRTEGGYIVIAPSLHNSGRRYEWANDLQPAEAPRWLIDEIAKHGGSASAGAGDGQYDYWARIAGGVREGERHVAILKLAGLLVGDRRLPPTLSLTLLRSFNRTQCAPPLPDNEVDERFSRVVKREMAKLRGQP